MTGAASEESSRSQILCKQHFPDSLLPAAPGCRARSRSGRSRTLNDRVVELGSLAPRRRDRHAESDYAGRAAHGGSTGQGGHGRVPRGGFPGRSASQRPDRFAACGDPCDGFGGTGSAELTTPLQRCKMDSAHFPDAILISKGASMGRALASSLCICLVTSVASAQDEQAGDKFRMQNRLIFDTKDQLLVAGSQALSTGAYDEGIRLTHRGLERPGISDYERTTALANLCGAYAAKGEPDTAIEYCTQSLEVDAGNWRALSNRAYAHWLKGMHTEAESDLEAAAAINPGASQIAQIRGLINQSTLQPRVSVEDRQ